MLSAVDEDALSVTFAAPRLALSVPQGTVFAVAYSPDGSRVAAAGAHGEVQIWQAGAGTLTRILPRVRIG